MTAVRFLALMEELPLLMSMMGMRKLTPEESDFYEKRDVKK